MFILHSPSQGYVVGIDTDNDILYTNEKKSAQKFGWILHIAEFCTQVGASNLPKDISYENLADQKRVLH